VKKVFAMAILAIPMLAAPIVSYSTSGSFSNGTSPGTNVYTGTNGTLTFLTGGGNVDVGTINPSNITLGTVDSNMFLTPEAVGGTLTLTITQTSPFAGTGSTMGTLSGTVVSNASNAMLLFSPAVVTLAGPGGSSTVYTVLQSPAGVPIVPSSSTSGGALAGGTTLQGTVQYIGGEPVTSDLSGVPEPATLGLMGLGLLAVGLVARRRRS